MKKTILNGKSPTGDFLVVRKQSDEDSKFPFNFYGEYEISNNDNYDRFNNFKFYQKINIAEPPIGMDLTTFPEIFKEGNISYLTNTGIVVIFTGEYVIIYDILDNETIDFSNINTSFVNNILINNDNNPANKRYISIQTDNEGYVSAIKNVLFSLNDKIYYTIDMDLTNIDNDYPDVYYENNDENFKDETSDFSFLSRQTFVFRSNLEIRKINVGDIELFSGEGDKDIFIDLTKNPGVLSGKYTVFNIISSTKNSSGWLEVS